MKAILTNGTNLNDTMITNSVLFSIGALDYDYDQIGPVYIQQRNISLTNQTSYPGDVWQQPMLIRYKFGADTGKH